ncbi:MAG: UvrB/UvrC motif-containing protein [Spirochaetaceae bacterium]|jgi:bifunctional DNase/RNase|nr:UvrB/UvrC motif-containing protein [Spirochaetaceae bacterium]
MKNGEIWTVARTSLGTVLLIKFRQEKRVLPIYLTNSQAQRILKGLEGKMESSLSVLFSKLLLHKKSGFIELGFNEGDIQAQLFLSSKKDQGNILDPVDAMELAVVAPLELRIEEELFENRAVEMNLLQRDEIDRLEQLEQRLEEAIRIEAYEDAAELRDQIRAIES